MEFWSRCMIRVFFSCQIWMALSILQIKRLIWIFTVSMSHSDVNRARKHQSGYTPCQSHWTDSDQWSLSVQWDWHGVYKGSIFFGLSLNLYRHALKMNWYGLVRSVSVSIDCIGCAWCEVHFLMENTPLILFHFAWWVLYLL